MEILYTPSDFVEVFNQSIDYSFGRVEIEGELTNFRVAKGRWVYFDLKDEASSLKCFGTVYMLPGPLEEGMKVRVVCLPRLHPQYNFSLQVQSIAVSGEGALVRAAELLRAKLEAEGLFAPERKRSIVYPPERICLIGSGESAAYADFIKIVGARWPLLTIDHIESQVQGDAAPPQLVAAITKTNESTTEYDAVVIIRGGGSADDLAAYSDERVVRAVAGSRYPTLVAIGHETDESLSELASDQRASTPSNAAELLVPDRIQISDQLGMIRRGLGTQVQQVTRRLKEDVASYRQRLQTELSHLVTNQQSHIRARRALLEAYNPLHVLSRGYALIRVNGKVVGSDVSSGTIVDIQFANGERKAEMK